MRHDAHSLPALRALSRVAKATFDWGDVKKWNRRILQDSPEDLEANLNLGIAFRETGKFKSLLLRSKDFGKAEWQFDLVMAIDSSYSDVLMQRAFLERRRDHWRQALDWGHRQLRKRPDLAQAQVDIYNLYRLYLVHASRAEKSTLFANVGEDWVRYLEGENLRRQGKLAEAEDIFGTLLAGGKNSVKIPAYLALVRLLVQQGKEPAASEFYWTAVAAIRTPADALFFFNDAKYLFKDSELDTFDSAGLAAKGDFIRAFWRRRELVPAAESSFRLVEHYRRLIKAEKDYWFDGVRSRVNNPDRVQYLRFPRFYALNQEFNDKGLIFIRHGEPDDLARTAGEFVATNESWLYHQREDRPKLIFHFMIARFATGNNWRLTPSIENREMLSDRLGWDHSISNVYLAKSTGELSSNLLRMAEASSEMVEIAMQSDYHTWDKKTEALTVPYHVANFRGEGGRTRLEVFFSTPLAPLASAQSDSIEFGSAVLSTGFEEVGRIFKREELDPPRSAHVFGDQFILAHSFELEPELYNLSFFVRQKEYRRLGGENFEVSVPSFDRSTLAASDLVLASAINPAGAAGPFRRGDLEVVPNPAAEFTLNQAIHVYYEIYNLSRDAEGETSVETIHELVQLKKKRRGLGKLFGFGGKKKSVSLRDERSGTSRDMIEYVSFDVSGLEAGLYQLRVTVNDLVEARSIEKSVDLHLVTK